MSTEVKDAMGRPLVVGDYLAYAVSAGHSQVLNFYKLLEIKTSSDKYSSYTTTKLKVEYIGGHSWRSKDSKRKTSWVEYPETRALKIDGPDLTAYLLRQ